MYEHMKQKPTAKVGIWTSGHPNTKSGVNTVQQRWVPVIEIPDLHEQILEQKILKQHLIAVASSASPHVSKDLIHLQTESCIE